MRCLTVPANLSTIGYSGRICLKTCRWDHEGKIKTKRTPGNHRLYDIEPFLGPSEAPVHQPNKEGIIYARVSSKKQIADLERQIEHLRAEYPGYKVVRDVGSGINWKRRGLRSLLRYCMARNVREVVIAHRDRLSRLAFDILKFVIEESGAKLVVHDAPSDLTPAEELGEDLLSIVHIFSCRQYGGRKYRGKGGKKAKESVGPIGGEQPSDANTQSTRETAHEACPATQPDDGHLPSPVQPMCAAR